MAAAPSAPIDPLSAVARSLKLATFSATAAAKSNVAPLPNVSE